MLRLGVESTTALFMAEKRTNFCIKRSKHHPRKSLQMGIRWVQKDRAARKLLIVALGERSNDSSPRWRKESLQRPLQTERWRTVQVPWRERMFVVVGGCSKVLECVYSISSRYQGFKKRNVVKHGRSKAAMLPMTSVQTVVFLIICLITCCGDSKT